jgi:glycosyltransferase involved in cell wall biosynthesis
MAPEKNLWKLMAEFGLAADQNDNVYLLGVGGGSMLNEISEMAAELGLTHRTRFVGPVDPELVPAYLAIGDAFVSASVSEVLPLTVIEALATGLPVLAIESPGMHDIVVSDVSGLLVSGSKGSLAQAMVAVASNSGLHSRLGAGAKMAGQRFDIQNTIEQTLSLYRRLIERRDYVDRGTATACSARRADKSQQPEINERFSSSWQERSTSDHG